MKLAIGRRPEPRTVPVHRIAPLVAAQALPVGVVALVNILMTVALDPASRGRAVFAVSTGTLASSLLFLQMHVGATDLTRAGVQGAGRAGLRIVAVAVLPVLALGTVLVLAGSGTGQFLGAGLVGAAPAAIALYAARLVQGLGGARQFLLVMTAQAGTYGAFIAALFVTGNLSSSSVVVGWVASGVLGAVLALLIAARRGLLAAGSATAREVASPSFAALLGASGHLVLYRVDVVVLGLVATPAALGLYSLGRAVAELLWQFAEGVALSVFDEGPDRQTAESRAHRLAHHLRTYRLLGLPMAAALVGLFALLVYGWLPAYKGSVTLLLLLIPGVLIGGELRIYLQLLNVATAGRALRQVALLALVSSLTYVPLVVLGGAKSAAVGTLFIYGGNLVFVRRVARAVLAQTESPHA